VRPRRAGFAGLASLALIATPALAAMTEPSADAPGIADRAGAGEAMLAGSREAAPAGSGGAAPAATREAAPAGSRDHALRHAAAALAARPRPAPPRFLTARVRPGQSVALRSRPGGAAVATAADRTEFGSPRVLGVVRRRGAWLGVTTPDRPNGTLAWIRRDRRVTLRRTAVSVRVDLSRRTLAVRRGGRVLTRATVAIGMPGSPTPTGRFAVTDKLSGPRFSASYGCCILALSGTQPNPPPGWSGGNRLAIHGTYGPVGSPTSAGCVRAANPDMERLMRLVPAGAPVFIGP
jgi:lipoprotein-anchoring transpeptidase ErfK/SrfK